MTDKDFITEVMELTDQALANALIYEVWADLPLGSRREALVFEAINRLDVSEEEAGDD